MPELDFLMNEEDEINIVLNVISEGGYLIPELNYMENVYAKISNIEDFKKFRKETRYFFIIFDDYYESPLEMRELLKDNEKKYYIGQRHGGPTLDFLTFNKYVENNSTFITTCSISHYPSYWSTKDNSQLKAPEALKEHYQELVKIVRKKSIKAKVQKRVYHITKNLLYDVEKGKIKFGYPFDTMGYTIVK